MSVRHNSSRSGSGAALHPHTAISSPLLGPISPDSLRSIPARKPWLSPWSLACCWDHKYKHLLFTPNKNLPQSPERSSLCFVLYLLGRKLREMFNTKLEVSAVFHSCGWLCPQELSNAEQASLHTTQHKLLHAEKKSSAGALCFMLGDHSVIFRFRSCRKTLWAVQLALGLLSA